MKNGITAVFAFASFVAVVAVAGTAKAEMVFRKDSDKSVVLTLKNDNTATISKISKVQSGEKRIETTFIEGKIEVQDSFLIIVRDEGDVCPSVSVELYHDISLGENMSAEVRNKFEDAGTAAREYCHEVRAIDGSYSRVK